MPRWARRLSLALFVPVAVLAGLERWVAHAPLPPLAREMSATVVDAEGTLLRAYTVGDGRWRLRAGAVDPLYLELLLAFEDQRYHRHPGVDPLALLRAAWQGARTGRIVSGGSTLTMQVARLLRGPQPRGLAVKVDQMRLALALERRLDKSAILSLYLHLAPFGGNLEGVRAASLTWFGKEPGRLTPAEAALLVALPQSPNTRRPDRFPDAARKARARVLARGLAAGVLTAEAVTAANAAPLPRRRRAFPALAPHLSDRLRQPGQAVATTLDAGVQASLEALIAARARALGPAMSGAVIAVEHSSGEIRAMVGSAGLSEARRQGFVDMTERLRSPGSTLKPLIYGLAFEAGIAHPETLVEDRPTDFNGYAPQNFDGRWRGTITARQALQASANIPAVAVLERLGPATLMAGLRRAGVDFALPDARPPGLALALGGGGTSLRDLVALYGGIAAGGRRIVPHALPQAAETLSGHDSAPILSPASAWQVQSILAGLVPPGGGAAGDIAYKTGTSYGHRDAWAIGFDGRHVIGVWFGRPDGGAVPGMLGAEAAAPVLFEAFAHLGAPTALRSPPPEALVAATASLPPPLRRMTRNAGAPSSAVRIAFPPDAARLAPAGGILQARIQRGTPPFRWLLDGRPLEADPWERDVALPLEGVGYRTLTVIDVDGTADRTKLFLKQPR